MVAQALGQFDPGTGTEAAIPLLAQALHDETNYDADSAAIALGHLWRTDAAESEHTFKWLDSSSPPPLIAAVVATD